MADDQASGTLLWCLDCSRGNGGNWCTCWGANFGAVELRRQRRLKRPSLPSGISGRLVVESGTNECDGQLDIWGREHEHARSAQQSRQPTTSAGTYSGRAECSDRIADFHRDHPSSGVVADAESSSAAIVDLRPASLALVGGRRPTTGSHNVADAQDSRQRSMPDVREDVRLAGDVLDGVRRLPGSVDRAKLVECEPPSPRRMGVLWDLPTSCDASSDYDNDNSAGSNYDDDHDSAGNNYDDDHDSAGRDGDCGRCVGPNCDGVFPRLDSRSAGGALK